MKKIICKLFGHRIIILPTKKFKDFSAVQDEMVKTGIVVGYVGKRFSDVKNKKLYLCERCGFWELK